MISEKTISTWLAEFSKKQATDDPNTALERLVILQGNVMRDEPMACAIVVQIINQIKFESPGNAAILALAIYHDCLRKQREADKLKSDIG